MPPARSDTADSVVELTPTGATGGRAGSAGGFASLSSSPMAEGGGASLGKPLLSADDDGAAAPSKAAADGQQQLKGVPFQDLFRFADTTDRWLMAVSLGAAMADGVTYPSFSFLFAGLLDSFFNPTNLVASVEKYALYLFAIAVGSFVVGTLKTACAMTAAERQGVKLRSAYFAALLRQDAGYYDTHRTGEVASRMAEDTLVALEAIGEKLAGAVSSISTFVMSLALGFARGPDLSGVVMAFVPVIAILGAVFAVGLSKWQRLEQDAYAAAGASASEAISSIRTVAAYGGERAEARRYGGYLRRAEAVGVRKGWAMGATVGAIFGVLQGSYGVALWYGSTRILQSRAADPTCRYDPTHAGCYTGGTVINCFFAIITAAFALAGVVPFLGTAASATAAAARIYEVIDRVPVIDSDDPGGLQPDPSTVTGRIEFRNVTFAYPSRPDQPVLRDFSVVIEPGAWRAAGEDMHGRTEAGGRGWQRRHDNQRSHHLSASFPHSLRHSRPPRRHDGGPVRRLRQRQVHHRGAAAAPVRPAGGRRVPGRRGHPPPERAVAAVAARPGVAGAHAVCRVHQGEHRAGLRGRGRGAHRRGGVRRGAGRQRARREWARGGCG
jgi:hypothetical protein